MEGVWDDDYEDDDFFDYYGEAQEVPEPETKKAKVLNEDGEEVEVKEPKPKRVVMNPRPKLDVDRLLSEEGLPTLLRRAANISFTEGNEVEDMKRTLALVGHWAHKLFPRYTFDDFTMKCENLGKKRPIKTHLRKVRIGMIPI